MNILMTKHSFEKQKKWIEKNTNLEWGGFTPGFEDLGYEVYYFKTYNSGCFGCNFDTIDDLPSDLLLWNDATRQRLERLYPAKTIYKGVKTDCVSGILTLLKKQTGIVWCNGKAPTQRTPKHPTLIFWDRFPWLQCTSEDYNDLEPVSADEFIEYVTSKIPKTETSY